VLRPAADLPDARVRLRPDPADQIGDPGKPPGDVGIDPVTGAGEYPGGLKQLAVGVELNLTRRSVGDPDRPDTPSTRRCSSRSGSRPSPIAV